MVPNFLLRFRAILRAWMNSAKSLAAAGMLAVPISASVAASPAWPPGSVRMLVPAPAGGASDMIARLLAEKLSARLNRPFIVENMPGASGTIAARALVGSAADGSVLLVGPSGLATEVPHVMKLPFDPLKDMVQIAELSRSPMVLLANAALPASSLEELAQYARANPGKLSVASYSAGTRSHYAAELFTSKTGANVVHVPYKGSPPAIVDLVAGHVSLAFDVTPNVLGHIRTGKLKAIAIVGDKRSPLLPNVPTFAERGYAELNSHAWIGMWVPRRTSEATTRLIHEEVKAAWDTAAVREKLRSLGFEPAPDRTMVQQQSDLNAQFESNREIVHRFGIKLN